MASLQIHTGKVKVTILDDFGNVRGDFVFNPDDVAVAQKFVNLQQELLEKKGIYEQRVKSCKNSVEQAELLNELVEYFNAMLDDCYGPGTSDLLFGGAKTISMFIDFFEGITPYYEEASKKRMAKYSSK